MSPPAVDGVKKPYETALYQEVLIKWLAAFTQAKSRGSIGSPLFSYVYHELFFLDASSSSRNPMRTSMLQLATPVRPVGAERESQPERRPAGVADRLGFGERSDRNIVCKVLYSNRENVNMIHEVFRQVRVT